MKKVYMFPKGGISFADSFKDPTIPHKKESERAFLPNISVIPLIQHSGAKATPLISVGDMVKEGMLIARAQGKGSSNIHATIPGKVIDSVTWEMVKGAENSAFVISLGGSFDKLGKIERVYSWNELSPITIQQIISDYGVVEMEGLGKPLSEILVSTLSVSSDEKTLVVRCVFDDPWLSADYVLCKEKFKSIVEGSAIVCKCCEINRIVFAFSQKEKDLADIFLEEARQYNELDASVMITGSIYPQKNRRELEIALKDYERIEGYNLGSFLMLGPATLSAVYDAVKLKKPILDRYVAVGGSAIRYPDVMKVRIGTRLSDIFAECGGFKGEPQRVIIGSPLSGRKAVSLDEPIVKTTYAIGAFLEGEKTIRRSCVGCGECRMVCPVELDPEALFKEIEIAGRIPENAQYCHACGCCDLVCPSRLPLSIIINNAFSTGNKK